jgi:hypothetical protein
VKNLFQPDAVNEVLARIDKLPPTTQLQWGKMDVGQRMRIATRHSHGLPGFTNPLIIIFIFANSAWDAGFDGD